jgi:hypothetical protein
VVSDSIGSLTENFHAHAMTLAGYSRTLSASRSSDFTQQNRFIPAPSRTP